MACIAGKNSAYSGMITAGKAKPGQKDLVPSNC